MTAPRDSRDKATASAEAAPREQAPPWLTVAPVLFLLIWSSGFAFSKMGLQYAEPLTFLAMRYGAAVAILLPIFLIMRPALPRTARDFGHLAVVGFLTQVVYFGLSYFAYYLGMSVGAVALILSLQPILVALLAPLLVRERVSLLRWLGLVLGLLGAALVIGTRSETTAATTTGVLCVVGSLIGMTIATLYEKRFGQSHHPVSASLVQYVVGFAVMLPLAGVADSMVVIWSWELVLSLGYLVIGNSLISITLLLAMIRYGETAQVSALFFLVPPIAALMAWVLLGEVLPALAWIGMAVAAAGVAIAGRPDARLRRS